MGYCVDINISGLNIVGAENIKGALAAINAMHDPKVLAKQAGGGSSTGERWYSWVRNPSDEGFKSLVDAMKAWRYDAGMDLEGETPVVTIECFDGEKWGDDEFMYEAIAPFVSEGCKIACLGEDGDQWRYTFNDGKVIEDKDEDEE